MSDTTVTPALVERLDWLFSAIGGVKRAIDNSPDSAPLRELRQALDQTRFLAMSIVVDAGRARKKAQPAD